LTTPGWPGAGPHRRGAGRAAGQLLQGDVGLLHEAGKVRRPGVRRTRETGANTRIQARCVVNATGVWVDALRQQDGEAHASDGAAAPGPWWRPARACTWWWTARSWPATTALMVPKTADGRVLFAVPWLGKVILGTTDTPRRDLAREPGAVSRGGGIHPVARRRYLRRAPTRRRPERLGRPAPLVKPQATMATTPRR
jgi:glycerol-3-phosphate dehydrogenase